MGASEERAWDRGDTGRESGRRSPFDFGERCGVSETVLKRKFSLREDVSIPGIVVDFNLSGCVSGQREQVQQVSCTRSKTSD